MNIRHLVEKLGRGQVLRRRLPPQFGRLRMYVTPECGLRYLGPMKRVDSVLYGMAEELVSPGSVVWDIGANVGLFTFCASALAGTTGFVLAVEPDYWLAHLMTRSVHANAKSHSSTVQVLCAAVSDSNRVSKLQIAERARASNHLADATGSTQAEGSREMQASVTVTLDHLLDYFPAPSVLKIDVETHEESVLKGAVKLLQEVRPTVWCEVSEESSRAVTELLHSAGYQLWGAATQPHPPIPRAWFHTLAVPPARDCKSGTRLPALQPSKTPHTDSI